MAARSNADNSPIAIGGRVKELRRHQGLTQHQISSPGMTNAHISELEKGRYVPTRQQIEQLANLLGCPPIYLSHGISEEEFEHLRVALSAARDALYGNLPELAIEGFTEVIRDSLSVFFPNIANEAILGRANARETVGQFDLADGEYRVLVERLTPADRWWGDAAAGIVRCLHHAGDPDAAIEAGLHMLEAIGTWRQRPGAWGAPGLRIASDLLPAYVSKNDQDAALKLIDRIDQRLGIGHGADLRFEIYMKSAHAHATFGNLEGFLNYINLAFSIAEREGLGTPPVLVNSYAHTLLESGFPGGGPDRHSRIGGGDTPSASQHCHGYKKAGNTVGSSTRDPARQ